MKLEYETRCVKILFFVKFVYNSQAKLKEDCEQVEMRQP